MNHFLLLFLSTCTQMSISTICVSPRVSKADLDILSLQAQYRDNLGQHLLWILYYPINNTNWKALVPDFHPWGGFKEKEREEEGKKREKTSAPLWSPQIPGWLTGDVWQCSYNCWDVDKSPSRFIPLGNATGYLPVHPTETVPQFLIYLFLRASQTFTAAPQNSLWAEREKESAQPLSPTVLFLNL